MLVVCLISCFLLMVLCWYVVAFDWLFILLLIVCFVFVIVRIYCVGLCCFCFGVVELLRLSCLILVVVVVCFV